LVNFLLEKTYIFFLLRLSKHRWPLQAGCSFFFFLISSSYYRLWFYVNILYFSQDNLARSRPSVSLHP
jgi:hypothetical protein